MNREEALQSIRPQIAGIVINETVKPLESFQNQTLRPLLKFQNELLLELFRDYANQRKGVFFQLSALKQQAYIAQNIQKDRSFRALLIGTIIGHFTKEELHFYLAHKSEVNKRCNGLLIQRFQSQLDWFRPSES